jgi:hypothetical protein
MNDDIIGANRRGSSPPFQEPESDFFRWLNGLKSIGQRDEKAWKVQEVLQARDRKTKSSNLNDESRWQDEGGEGG